MSSSAPLPSPRRFLQTLISALPPAAASTSTHPPTSPAPANPLPVLSSPDKALFLTLHVLFPNELLPALDLLDRRLVTRFIIISASASAATEENAPAAARRPANVVYYVRSAQQQPNRFHARSGSRGKGRSSGAGGSAVALTTPHYEVRLQAWNCSCPAFAFAAFPAAGGAYASRREDGDDEDHEGVGSGGQGDVHEHAGMGLSGTRALVPGAASGDAGAQTQWRFGGLSRSEGKVSVCKHLLACLLGEQCGLFGGFVEEREVGIEEAAGWAAGWAA